MEPTLGNAVLAASLPVSQWHLAGFETLGNTHIALITKFINYAREKSYKEYW